jgi:hypothetical protein
MVRPRLVLVELKAGRGMGLRLEIALVQGADLQRMVDETGRQHLLQLVVIY